MSAESNTPYTFETLRSCTLVIVGNYDVTKKVFWDKDVERWFTVSGEGFRSLQGVANSCLWGVSPQLT